jgi:hypothetical protein
VGSLIRCRSFCVSVVLCGLTSPGAATDNGDPVSKVRNQESPAAPDVQHTPVPRCRWADENG